MISSTFGAMLYQLRKRAGMTQSDLAAAVGYSASFISGLEKGNRHVEWRAVVDLFVPALALHEEPGLAMRLVELAAAVRGERPPTTLSFEQKFKPALTQMAESASHPLPNSPTALVGREADVRVLINRFVGHNGRLMTLTGPPGVGKTRLALEAAARLQPQFEHGVRFIPLASIRDPERVVLTLGSLLEIPNNGKLSPQARLLQTLRHQELLLVLDNFEQILPAASLLADLLAECSRLHLLITSRERLHLRAEQRFRVQPLPMTAATQLFWQCAQRVDPEVTFTSEDHAAIAGICQRLDGLPLAIELVALRLDMFTPATLWRQLQQGGLDLLNDGPADLPARQRTLRSTILDSYALLNEQEKRLFRTLGVFRGSFDEDALHGVGGDAETLRALINKSLVVQDRQATMGQRFFLLATLQEFALEQLAANGELLEAEINHTQHFLRLVEQLDAGMSSDVGKFLLEQIHSDYENVLQAIRWTIQQHTLEIAVRFVWPMRLFWQCNLREVEKLILQEILTWAECEWDALMYLPPASLTPHHRFQIALFAKVLFTCVKFLFPYGTRIEEDSEAAQLLAKCANLNAVVEPDDLTPPLLHLLSDVKIEQGNFAEAIHVNQRCLQLLQIMPDLRREVQKSEIAWTYRFLGYIALQQGDVAGCREYYSQSAAVFAEINQSDMVAIIMFDLCAAELYLGEVEQARNLFDTYTMPVAVGNEFYFPFFYSTATTLAVRQQQWQAAKTAIRQGAQFLVNHPQEYIQWQDPFLLVGKYAWLAWHEQRFDHAAQLVGMAEALRQQCVERPPAVCLAEYEATIDTIRAELDESTFATWYAQGHALSEREIFAWILAKTAES